MFGFLLRFARLVVQNVLSQLTKQLNVVEELALSPMRLMVQEVTGGVWKGEGANKFVEEVSNIMIPGVGQVCQQIRTVSTNVNRAVDVMDRADQQVNNLAKNTADLFKAIF
jgi:uncharacterized protein YukE